MLLVGCTVTIKPLTQNKKARVPRHQKHTEKNHPRKKQTNNVKETWWIENYHKLEASHGAYTIPSDVKIRPLPDGRFLVPDEVLKHYQDLLLVTPTPKP